MLLSILLFILVLCTAIIFHEFGHLLVAKKAGVEIESFGIFFPPRIAKLFTWKGTNFYLNSIPLGGYVQPKVINGASSIELTTPFRKVAIYLAGVTANLVLAFLCFFSYFAMVGTPDENKMQVDMIYPNSPALEAGVQVGDILYSLDGEPVFNTTGMGKILKNGQEHILTVIRGGEEIPLKIVPRWNDELNKSAIGVTVSPPLVKQPVWTAAASSFDATWSSFVSILEFPVDMVNNLLHPAPATPSEEAATDENAEFVGLIGMFDIFTGYMEPGGKTPVFFQVLVFFASLNVSLAGFNILPIPGLDGGHILLTLPEFFHRKLSNRAKGLITLTGLAFVFILGLIVNLGDIIGF